MWLILCESSDLSAIWLYKNLSARGIKPIELITSEELSYSLAWEHRIDCYDEPIISIKLADGRKIQSSDVCGTVNRIHFPHQEHFAKAKPEERSYAISELNAFFLSWLYALPGFVINKPTANGLFGHWRHISEWVLLASQAGLPTIRYRQSSNVDDINANSKINFPAGIATKTIIILEGCVSVDTPPVPPERIVSGCVNLAKISYTSLLGIDFILLPDKRWLFAGATPIPNLYLGGNKLLDAFENLMKK
jgi:hypothetical protein